MTITRLTQLSPRGGCACKLPRSVLHGLLGTVRAPGLPPPPALLAGLDAPDDAAVYAIDDTRAWIVTLDFQTPVVDDAGTWGRVAAANALSDVYAMGGRPLLALNILAWPEEARQAELAALLDGAASTVAAAGALTVGGHSITDPVPKFGLVVIGEADPRRLLTKGGARDGDHLVLTKALGTGIVGTAIRHGTAPPDVMDAAIASMLRLNDTAADAARHAGLRGGTDVSGYGLLGHLHEMAGASGLEALLHPDAIPVLPGVAALVAAGGTPGGTRRTLDDALAEGWLIPGGTPPDTLSILADAQTSGGLLLAVPPPEAPALLARLSAADDRAVTVGVMRRGTPGRVVLA